VRLQLSFSFFHNCQLRNSTLLYTLYTDPTENTACILDKACLPHRYLTIYLLFLASASAGMCLATRCLAMGMARGQHRKQFLKYLFYCVCVFRPLPRNRSTCHNISFLSGVDVTVFLISNLQVHTSYELCVACFMLRQ
jgi:hypothetical protein